MRAGGCCDPVTRQYEPLMVRCRATRAICSHRRHSQLSISDSSLRQGAKEANNREAICRGPDDRVLERYSGNASHWIVKAIPGQRVRPTRDRSLPLERAPSRLLGAGPGSRGSILSVEKAQAVSRLSWLSDPASNVLRSPRRDPLRQPDWSWKSPCLDASPERCSREWDKA